jgi:hypothetical protein
MRTVVKPAANRREASKDFPRDVAAHRVSILLDADQHRHLRCQKPGTWVHGFDIVTYPGTLCYSGDMGSFVFQRERDMFGFFRNDSGRINPQYWAEKLQATDRHGGFEEFDRRQLGQRLIDAYRDHVGAAGLTVDERRDLRQNLRDAFDHLTNEHECYAEVADFDSHGLRLRDAWEWRCREYTYRFIWACHAIVWAIGQYDAAKAAAAAPAVAA